jgi:hypothetical protein
MYYYLNKTGDAITGFWRYCALWRVFIHIPTLYSALVKIFHAVVTTFMKASCSSRGFYVDRFTRNVINDIKFNIT